MRITQLEYFQMAAKTGSITGAAEALHISQPSVSTAIKELESELGYLLLARKGKHFTLTREGAVFLEETNRLLSHVENFSLSMKALKDKTRQIHLGIPPMIGSLVLPALYRQFQGKKVPFRLDVTEAGRHHLLEQLAANEIDMAFLPHVRPFDSRFDVITVAEPETVCCLPPGHPLARKDSLCAADLQDEPLILFKNSFFQTERIMDWFRAGETEPVILLHTDQLSTIYQFVSRGLAASFLFRQVAETLPDMSVVPLSTPMKARISLVRRRSDYLPEEFRTFIEHVASLKI
jgi:DNA-binding transcriptional LysR family regulator